LVPIISLHVCSPIAPKPQPEEVTQQDRRDHIPRTRYISTSWLAELAKHRVYGVESRINLFSDLKVEENKEVSRWI
jgi:hypothetical protein